MNVILVDASYTTFHRFFATLRWLSFSKKEIYIEHKDDNTFDWFTLKEFSDTYKKMYLKAIIDSVGQTIYKNSKVIFCMDAQYNTLWRHEFAIQCYKGNRVDMSEKHNYSPTFAYTYDVLIPKLKNNNNNIYSILIPRMEADDIIALATRYIRYKRPNHTIYLLSGDNDFLQLGYDKLYIVDYKKKEHICITPAEAKEHLRIKIVSGDCSDNIPSIFPAKLNNKIKKAVREDENVMKQFLKDYPEARKSYNNNKKLISFKYIPKHFRKPIYKMVSKIVKKI